MNFEVDIRELNKVTRHGYIESSLVLDFSGKSINHIVLNTLRRIMIQDIPCYAFAPECILIERNTSKLNNDQIKDKFMQIPIFDTYVDTYFLPAKYWKDVNYANNDREKYPSEKSIELYISATNNTNEIINVTTKDIKYLEDSKDIKNKYESIHPIALLKLCPMESLQCRLIGVLGVGERNNIWSCVETVTYDIISEHNIKLTIESQGQMDEYEILYKACLHAINKCDQLIEYFKRNPTTNKAKNIELIIDNEDHTIGNILTYIIQDNPIVQYAGFHKPNFLIKQIVLKIEYSKELDNPMDPIIGALQYIIKLMDYIRNKVYNLGNKYIQYHQNEPKKNDKKSKSKTKTSK